MADIFSKPIISKSGPLARAETMELFVEGQLIGLAQQVQINYQQTVTPVYELGTFAAWHVSGRTSGNIGMARVIGDAGRGDGQSSVVDVLSEKSLKVDTNTGSTITLKDTLTGVTYRCIGCHVVSLGTSVSANDTMVLEQVQIIFKSLELSRGGGGSGGGGGGGNQAPGAAPGGGGQAPGGDVAAPGGLLA